MLALPPSTMLDTGLPSQEHWQTPEPSLSPSATTLLDASSTFSIHPRTSSLDGPPQTLSSCPPPPPPPPPRPRSAPAMIHRHVPATLTHPDNRHEDVEPVPCPGRKDLHFARTTMLSMTEDMAKTKVTIEPEVIDPVMPLNEICRLLRLQKYQKRKCHRAQENLRRLLTAATRTARLASASSAVHVTLGDCIRLEDKRSFAKLFTALNDACDACSVPDAIHHPDEEPSTTDAFTPTTPLLQRLSVESRTAVLDLLTRSRYDSDFIASRLDNLSPQEIHALLPGRALSRSNDSIFGGTSRVGPRGSRPSGDNSDTQVEMMRSQSFGSPLETLIRCPRAASTTGTSENESTTDVWAAVCAKLIARQSSGTEKLVASVVTIFAHMFPWPGKARLEVWILQILREGAFLLEQPAKQTFRARVEGGADVAARREARAQAFYSSAAERLLDLLADQTDTSVIPPGALKFGLAISSRLQPDSHRVFPQFVVIKWLFSSFIVDAISLPESHGLLADTYISEMARQRILLEIARKAQSAVVDVAYQWKYGHVVPQDTTLRVQRLMNRFRSDDEGSSSHPSVMSSGVTTCKHHEVFLTVSLADILTLLDALYPRRKPMSVASDRDNLVSGLRSSASSVSGFSIFDTAKVSEAIGLSANPPEDTPDSGGPAVLSVEDSHGLSDSQINAVRVELAAIMTNKSRTPQETIDILVTAAGSQTLCTIDERWAGLISDREHSERQKAGFQSTISQEPNHCVRRNLAREALELILQQIDRAEIPMPSDVRAPVDGAAHLRSQISALFARAIRNSEDVMDFPAAFIWSQQHENFSQYFRGTDCGPLRGLIDEVADAAWRSSEQSSALEKACESWTATLKSSSQLQQETVDDIRELSHSLRDKMWYVAEVRPTAHFDEVKAVANALRILGKSRVAKRGRSEVPAARPWNAIRTSNTSVHLMSEVQILDYLSARPEHGGPNKLSDEQSEITSLWIQRQGIDNLCTGEERLHKLCMEVLRCLDSTMAQLPLAPSGESPLSSREAQISRTSALHSKSSLHSGSQSTARQSRTVLHSERRSLSDLSTTSCTLSSMSSRDFFESRSPTLTHRSSIFSNATTETDPPSSVTSVGPSIPSTYRSVTTALTSQSLLPGPTPRTQLRERLLGLLLSDVTFNLFTDGCESDRAFWTGLGSDLMEKHVSISPALKSCYNDIESGESLLRHPVVKSSESFDYDRAFVKLLDKFSASGSPAAKLDCLYDIDRLLVPYMTQSARTHEGSTAEENSPGTDGPLEGQRARYTTEENVRGFRMLFARKSLRPRGILRDLQYIAALTPASTLQYTARGKAFYNAALAILDLKQKLSVVMLETADSIIAYHSNNRGHERTTSSAQQQRDSATFPSPPSRTSSAEDIARYTMADAAYLLQITAKEGDAIAQRELATLYLTHPELMEHILAPFARPQKVFTRELEAKWRKNQDPAKSDPTTMCVAMHWMSLSSKSGDALATESLRQWNEMDSF